MNTYAFPWGIYIGDLIASQVAADTNDIPVLLPANAGGFAVDYDEASETISNCFIENVVLLLAQALPPKALHIHVFDFDTAPRFRYLSQLKSHGLYHLYPTAEAAKKGFDEIEATARNRLHELLPPDVADISEYNQAAQYPEPYHLLLINGDYYPDDLIGAKRIRSFFDSASKAGIYTIFYNVDKNNEEVNDNRKNSLAYLRQRFNKLMIHDKTAVLSAELFEFSELCEYYDYQLADANQTHIMQQLIDELTESENSNGDSDFLRVPIAKTRDGRQDI